ncbi:MAG: hypothetical protein NC301_06055 [Bacteroides sp.]|nr:hypothetical protein [Bacteroides sp.]MCM1379025.1 hypothetical protein [Bacteroides sp.]MCM1445641.1 hypothetical protein [Prevotella sp.]
MNKAQNILIVVVSTLTLTTLSACFTGIEKTPVIKDNTSSKSTAKITAEQELLSKIAPQPLSQWHAGKPFIVTSGRLSYAYSPTTSAKTLNEGDTLRFKSASQNIRLAGDTVTEIHLTTPLGSQISTVIESSLSSIANKPLPLPFTVDAELIDNIRSLLKGRKVWTLRPGKNGKRYQKTEITDVKEGNADFPFLVTTPEDSLLMVLSSRSASARTFNNLFTLSDPRKRYPQISNHNWELICQGRIAVEMTREECRLALGTPAQIDRDATYSGLLERWTYPDGKYLIFTDGLLTRFRL